MRNVPQPETVAAHSWRMAVMAIQKEDVFKQHHLDTQRIIEMCLLHDVSETVVGDIVPEYAQKSERKISKEEKHLIEAQAINTFATTYHFPKLKILFNEYEAQETPESKIVKNLDKIDMLLQAYEYLTQYPHLTDLTDFLKNNEQFVDLEIFYNDLQEIKSRQNNSKETSNSFIDFQILAGKLKHINYTSTESVAAHDWQTAVKALHLEETLQKQNINVAQLIKTIVLHNMGKSIATTPEQEDLAIQKLARDFNMPLLLKSFNVGRQKNTQEYQFIKEAE